MDMSQDRLAEIAEAPISVSDKIRALSAAGVPRADIARILGRRYQQVRNVLEGDKVRSGRAGVAAHSTPPPARAAAERPSASPFFRLEVDANGRLTLPQQVADKLGAARVPILIGELRGEEFTLIGAEESLRRAQEMMQPYVVPGRSLVDELIEDRREEVRREAQGG